MIKQKIKTLEMQLAALEADPAADVKAKIDALNQLADIAERTDFAQSMALSQRAHELAQSQQPPYMAGIVYSLQIQGLLNHRQANNILALTQLQEALALSEAHQITEWKSITLQALGRIYAHLGDFPTALDYYLQALAAPQSIGYIHSHLHALNELGILHSKLGDSSQAFHYYRQALSIEQALMDQEGHALLHNNLAMEYLLQGNYTVALAEAHQSLQLAEEIDVSLPALYILDTLSQIYIELEAYPKALHYVQKSLDLAIQLEEKSAQVTALLTIGNIHRLQQQNRETETFLEQARALAEAIDDQVQLYQIHQALAKLYKQQGDFERALVHYEEFHRIESAVFHAESERQINNLQVIHQTQQAEQEAEIYRLKNVELEAVLAQVKKLSGLLPICAHCKKIRDDGGYWQDVAVYVRDHSEAEFSHGICPDCRVTYYPQLAKSTRPHVP